MSAYEDELAARAARARDVALFRYSVIRAAADPGLPPRQRGLLVRELAAGQHKDPAGQPVSIGRSTLDRWIRLWAAGGFDALVPGGRQVAPRTGAGVLELAVALKKEKPERTAAQVTRVLAARLAAGQVPSVRTIQRHFVRMDLAGPAAHGHGQRPVRPVRGRRTRRAVGLRRAARPAGRRRRQDVPVRHRG